MFTRLCRLRKLQSLSFVILWRRDSKIFVARELRGFNKAEEQRNIKCIKNFKLYRTPMYFNIVLNPFT